MEIYSDDFRYKNISNPEATIVSPISDSLNSSCFLYVGLNVEYCAQSVGENHIVSKPGLGGSTMHVCIGCTADYTIDRVITTKEMTPILPLRVDENYIFSDSETNKFNPIYCTPSYDGCNVCVDSCNTCYSGCQTTCFNCQGCTGSCQNRNGCSSCDSSNTSIECAATVGCPSNIFTRSMAVPSGAPSPGCTICVNGFSCTAYVDSMLEMCGFNDCGGIYGNCSGGCVSDYQCSLYVACGSACMLCNTSGYTCNDASCYSKVYKF